MEARCATRNDLQLTCRSGPDTHERAFVSNPRAGEFRGLEGMRLDAEAANEQFRLLAGSFHPAQRRCREHRRTRSMKIVCESCGAKYSIADDRVTGKVFKIRCKRCSEVIIVRGDQQAQQADEPAAAASTSDGTAIWHIVVEGEQAGPYTPQQLGEMLTAQTRRLGRVRVDRRLRQLAADARGERSRLADHGPGRAGAGGAAASGRRWARGGVSLGRARDVERAAFDGRRSVR